MRAPRPEPSGRGGISRIVVVSPSDSMFWMVKTANPHYEAADSVFSLDVALDNWMNTPVGTRDGTTVLGFKLFLAENPQVLSLKSVPDSSEPVALTGFYAVDSVNTVRILNPDGRQALLSANQPYFTYSEKLNPGQMSSYRTWQFHVPNTVETFMFTVQLFAPTLGEAPVPAQAPDTIPSWLFAPENVVSNLPGLSGRYVKNAISVLFMPGTTVDERAAAISIVNGRVVGGYPQEIGEGLYYVTLPPDSTTATTLQAVDQLNQLPQVAGATVVFAESAELQLDWLKPDDGPGWERRDWNADSIPEYSLRWGLEAIRAPLAWGCETGAQNVPIGVIDHGFHPESIPDIQANLVRLHNPLLVLQGGHGDLVSAIVGARGNDGARMTGVMWAAGLHLLENSAGPGGKTFVDDNDLLVSLGIGNQILAAANAGARVINISSGANWTQVEDAQIRLGHPTPDMNRRLQEYGTDIRRALRSLGANNIKPLWSFPPAMMDTTRNGTDTHRSSASFRRR